MKKKRAFTLIELMIAISIMMVIMAALTYMFVQVSRAVSRGVGESKMLNDALAFSDRLYDDATNIVRPGAGGHIAIYNNRLTTDSKVTPRGATVANIRTDQLYFSRYRGDTNPMAAQSSANLAPDITIESDVIQVWYGHTSLIDTTDSDKTFKITDSYAMNWHLGRQALFFAPNEIKSRYASTYTASEIDEAKTDVIKVGWGDVVQQIRGNVTYANSRFRKNNTTLTVRKSLAKVDNDADAVTLDFDNVSADEISQMHPSFITGVGQFEVSFAGDFDLNGYIDVADDGSIKWYDAYDKPTFNLIKGRAEYNPDVGGNTFSWHPDDYGPNSLWPKMIRIRYRMYAPSNQYEDDNTVPKLPMEHIININ